MLVKDISPDTRRKGEVDSAEGVAAISFGLPSIDRVLGGGLRRAALHEVFAMRGGDAPAADGFALALMLRAASARKIIWVREQMAEREAGELYPRGLAAFGGDPASIVVVRVRDALSALRAAHEALQCPALGAVALGVCGAPKALDLTATRRLALAAEKSGVTAFLVRQAAEPMPSAAQTRWQVRARPSCAQDGAPGAAAFDITLMRHRAGLPVMSFCVEWDHDQCAFRGPAHTGAVATLASRRPAAAFQPLRRAG